MIDKKISLSNEAYDFYYGRFLKIILMNSLQGAVQNCMYHLQNDTQISRVQYLLRNCFLSILVLNSDFVSLVQTVHYTAKPYNFDCLM